MKKTHTLALTTLAAAMAAGTAFAQQPTTPPPAAQPDTMMQAREDKKPSYEELNVRGDGRVTRADLSALPRILEKFDDIDSDGDGTISSAEWSAWKSDKDDRGERRPDY